MGRTAARTLYRTVEASLTTDMALIKLDITEGEAGVKLGCKAICSCTVTVDRMKQLTTPIPKSRDVNKNRMQ